MIEIVIPRTSERIRGLTLPKDGIMFVADYDEVFKITLGDVTKVEVLDDDPYEFLDSQEHVLGVYNHAPILESNGNSISYKFWPPTEFGTLKHKINNFLGRNQDIVTVQYKVANVSGKIEFRTLSGDWFSASFSKCGKYLVIAEPYMFKVFKINGIA